MNSDARKIRYNEVTYNLNTANATDLENGDTKELVKETTECNHDVKEHSTRVDMSVISDAIDDSVNQEFLEKMKKED